MLRILRKLRVLLDRKQKRTMGGLVFLMILGAFLQTVGVGMIIPVVAVAMDSAAIRENKLVYGLYLLLGGGSEKRFTVRIMLLLIGVFLVKNLFLYVQQKITLAFVYTNQFRTSERMMKNYLRRGYEYYLNADTAVIQRSITSDVNNMYALILSLLQLLSDGIVFVFLTVYCFAQDPAMTILLAAVLILLLLVIERVLKPIMHRAGEDNQNYYSGLFKWISQTVQGIKEVKIAGKEQYFVSEYIKCGQGYVTAVRKYSLYSSVPKLLIETVCVICMIGYMMYMVLREAGGEALLQTVGTFAAAALILLPCVNRINNQLNSIAYFEPFLLGVDARLRDEISERNTDISFAADSAEKLPVKDRIEIRDITYAYPGTEKKILDHADLTIPAGRSVGIVGTSGAGKSTVADLLLGLLEAQGGSICADGTDIRTQYRKWLKNIGYIPQMIFMLDDTIRKNVAFGVPEEQIDETRFWEALKEAQLDEFVRSLPEGADTGVGERGIRLSGGQRQRIGIARALYSNPEVLILDEATSALDHDTEAAIMESINRLHGKKTLVIIAHRLQTIQKCDLVYRVEDGKAKRDFSLEEGFLG
ncbi:MAG: ABC transporter ATP-binding protein/permease [Clostridium sp.]|jgi:ABC-type multidrug transport system fused ATPase/permease subunit|nr:ABC transporter ATP-binding protein/permease [Clostridium sp.]